MTAILLAFYSDSITLFLVSLSSVWIEVTTEFVIRFALCELGGKLDMACSMVFWLEETTTDCFLSSSGWKRVMWFLMFVVFPKYFS